MKPYNPKELFAHGLIAFKRIFGGLSAEEKEYLGIVKATPGAFGKPATSKNPAGSKNLRRWYKHKTGMRGTYEEALNWYRELK